MPSVTQPDAMAILHVLIFLTIYVPLCLRIDKNAKKRTRR